jgi:cytochrome c-type biogenesis protein CcmH
VRERLKAGDSDAQVVQFVEDRYGEFVLLRPPLSVRTVLLWVAPVFALLIALWVSYHGWRRRKLQWPAPGSSAAPLSPEEEARLRKILADDAEKSSSDR